MSAASPKFLKVPERVDDRGRLRIFEIDYPLPFVPLRSFVISNVQRGKTRAGHILSCDQTLTMLQGGCRLTVKNGTNKEEYHFKPEDGAIYLQRGTWLLLSEFDSDAIMLVFASERFDISRDFPNSE
jgi:UDP-2-acetamido-3-amino-2,3-dideoxy-glucuronate N-acetyltransferase